jgi:hypothetical protein
MEDALKRHRARAVVKWGPEKPADQVLR